MRIVPFIIAMLVVTGAQGGPVRPARAAGDEACVLTPLAPYNVLVSKARIATIRVAPAPPPHARPSSRPGLT